MNVADLSVFFEERFQEVEEYLELLAAVEAAAQSGPPQIADINYTITAAQQKILYSSVYLQLYNLVEATVSRCISAVTDAARDGSTWQPHQLNDDLQREWVRATARTHTDLTPEKRLIHALRMTRYIFEKFPIDTFSIDLGSGGNWDDESIFAIARRIGCRITISGDVQKGVKIPLRDDAGAMKLVKMRRNSLAHGSISFVDCADGVGLVELAEIGKCIGAYLREVVASFIRFIAQFEFIDPRWQLPVGSP